MSELNKNGLGLFYAVPSDAAAIAAIEKQCFSEPWSEKATLDEITADNCIFIVCRDKVGSTVGYISARDNCGELYINNVAVEQSCRKKGIGEALLRELVERGDERGCEFVTLEVRESNGAARSLYEKCGFEEVGIRRGFYRSPGENAVLYTKFYKK